jgi:recombination associated protein RdgC
MWFKNLRLYRLTAPLPCETGEIEELLAKQAFTPCSGLDTTRTGWVGALLPQDGALLHSHGGLHLLCARTQTRVLPASAIREAVDEQVSVREAREGRKLGRRERADLKDEVVQTLLPRALTRSQLTRAVFAEDAGWLMIDSGPAPRAEDVLGLLRESLGSLAVKPFVPARNPAELLTQWLSGGRLPKRFKLGEHCDLRDPLHQKNVVRCRAQELATREVRNHLEAGKQVFGLGLGWNERLQFVLTEDLSLHGIRYEDVRERDAGDQGGESETEELGRLDADFVLMAMELEKVMQDLVEVFGIAD